MYRPRQKTHFRNNECRGGPETDPLRRKRKNRECFPEEKIHCDVSGAAFGLFVELSKALPSVKKERVGAQLAVRASPHVCKSWS